MHGHVRSLREAKANMAIMAVMAMTMALAMAIMAMPMSILAMAMASMAMPMSILAMHMPRGVSCEPPYNKNSANLTETLQPHTETLQLTWPAPASQDARLGKRCLTETLQLAWPAPASQDARWGKRCLAETLELAWPAPAS